MTNDEISYDVIVVGAGSAGAALAARLSEDPSRRVLLLEAGSVEPDREADQLANVNFAMTKRDWGMHATVAPGRVLEFPQGKAAGGGSAVNMALALRPLPEDLDAWAALGNPGWSWTDMVGALMRLEADPIGPADLHGANGPIPIERWTPGAYTDQQRAFLDGLVEVGQPVVADHNDGVATGIGPFPMNRRDGLRMSTAIGYLEGARERPNLSVIGGVLVDRVLFAGTTATAVVGTVGGEVTTWSGAEVVLSAGAVHSPAILQRSGVGDSALLKELGIPVVVPLGGVGQNLMEHPGAFLFVIPEPGVCDTTEVQFQLGARTTAPGSDERNDVLLGMMSHWDLRETPDFRDLVGADVIFTLTCGVLAPRSRGSVRISSTDPTEQPEIDLNLCGDPWDTQRLVDALRLQYQVVTSAAMAPRVKGLAMLSPEAFESDDDEALATYVEATCAPWYHPSGTCRMGPVTEPTAVVDASLCVHGTKNLRVVDASIMPTIVRATTNLTAIAIGERAAEIMGWGA